MITGPPQVESPVTLGQGTWGPGEMERYGEMEEEPGNHGFFYGFFPWFFRLGDFPVQNSWRILGP